MLGNKKYRFSGLECEKATKFNDIGLDSVLTFTCIPNLLLQSTFLFYWKYII